MGDSYTLTCRINGGSQIVGGVLDQVEIEPYLGYENEWKMRRMISSFISCNQFSWEPFYFWENKILPSKFGQFSGFFWKFLISGGVRLFGRWEYIEQSSEWGSRQHMNHSEWLNVHINIWASWSSKNWGWWMYECHVELNSSGNADLKNVHCLQQH